MKHIFKVLLTYPNGSQETMKITARTINEAISFCEKINSESTMTAELCQVKRKKGAYVC